MEMFENACGPIGTGGFQTVTVGLIIEIQKSQKGIDLLSRYKLLLQKLKTHTLLVNYSQNSGLRIQ